MSVSDQGRVRSYILSRLRAKPGRYRCPDPEGGAEQHDPNPQHHKDKNFVEEWMKENGARVCLELVLWYSSTVSCCMMERLARPEANPSAAVFVASIWAYTTATGAIYFIHSDSRGVDFWILCGGLFGLVCGWMAGWTLVEIMFRVLPGSILFAFWLGMQWA